jgi:hypothetical protein
MRKKILLALFCVLSLLIQAQTRWGIFTQMNGFASVQAYSAGANLQINLGDNRSYLNYEIGGGITSDAKGVFHCNGGLPLAIFLLIDNEEKPWLKLVGILGLALPKGISYSVIKNDKAEVQLNINPLNLDYIGKNDLVFRRNYLGFSGDFGVSGIKTFDNDVFIKPYIGAKWLYANGWVGLQVGVLIGKNLAKEIVDE